MTAAWQSVSARSESLGTDLTINKPTGTVDGDILGFVGVCGAAQTISKPDASWTTASFSLGGQAPCFLKIASSEPASWTFAVSGTVSSVGQVFRINGHDTSLGLSAIEAGSGAFATSGTLVPASISSGGPSRLLFGAAVKLTASASFTQPGTMTERYDTTTPSQTCPYEGADEVVGSGATGTRTWTPSAGTSPGVAYMMVIKGAATNTTVSTDLTGDGVLSRTIAETMSRDLVGDGVVSRTLAGTMSRDLTGDGVPSRTLAETTSRDLTGDGVVSRSLTETTSRDLTGDGTITRSPTGVGVSRDMTGDGLLDRTLAGAVSRDLTGDGLVDRALAETTTRDLIGDGTISRGPLQVTVNRDLTGDGTVTRGGLPVSTGFDLTGDGTVDTSKQVSAFRTVDLVGDGLLTESHQSGLSRTFDLTGDGLISGSADIPFPDIPECAPDWSPNDGLKSISGTVLFHEPPNQGDPVSGATVCLFRDSDGVRIECTTTAPDGTYSFPRDTNDPYTYHVEVTYTDGGGTQQGLSESGCVPL